MPALSPSIKNLVANTRFTAVDLVTLQKEIDTGRANMADAEKIALHYADLLEPGIGRWLNDLLSKLGSITSVVAPLANLDNEQDLLDGIVILPDAGRKHPSVRQVQRSLMALAYRERQPGYLLPQFGADGDYGNETIQAVRTFQQNNGLPLTGIVEAKTAQAMNLALRSTPVQGSLDATPQDLIRAAIELTTPPISLNYGHPNPWVNIDPKHAVPPEKPFNFLIDRWKCNLFGGNVLRKGGYEPPFFGNQGKGEYPNANQWFKWSDKYAPQFGNKIHFQLIDEVPLTQLPPGQQLRAVNALLAKVRAGDVVLVDHFGEEIQDGGHVRVATVSNFSLDGTIDFAQAHFDQSVVEREDAAQFFVKPEETIWLVRPNRKM